MTDSDTETERSRLKRFRASVNIQMDEHNYPTFDIPKDALPPLSLASGEIFRIEYRPLWEDITIAFHDMTPNGE